jgi:tripartite-type tricarboxylate transporter receptor subunit TctC
MAGSRHVDNSRRACPQLSPSRTVAQTEFWEAALMLDRLRRAMMAACIVAFAPTSLQAQGPADFYRGKSIRFIVGSDTGGGFSTYALLLSQFLTKFIPGSPGISVEHMPGAGGINSLNYIANAAPRDGTVIAIAMPNFFVTPFTEPKAVKFNPSDFHFLGRMSDFGRVLAVWHQTGITSIDDLKTTEVTVGASSTRSTTSIAPMLMNEILGTKMKIITGYSGTGPTLVAIERGEVGSTTVAWVTLTSMYEHWLRDEKLRVIGGLDFNDVPIKGVPRVRDLIKDPQQLALWDFVALPAEFGTAVLTAPGVPAERVEILRAAFDAAMRSPEMIAEAQKRQLDINPKTGKDLDALFAKYGVPSPEIATHVARVMGVTN